jgi:hypothetical protein
MGPFAPRLPSPDVRCDGVAASYRLAAFQKRPHFKKQELPSPAEPISSSGRIASRSGNRMNVPHPRQVKLLDGDRANGSGMPPLRPYDWRPANLL